MIYFAGFVKGLAAVLYANGVIKHEIISGIDWNDDNDINDTKFWDAPHFEIKD